MSSVRVQDRMGIENLESVSTSSSSKASNSTRPVNKQIPQAQITSKNSRIRSKIARRAPRDQRLDTASRTSSLSEARRHVRCPNERPDRLHCAFIVLSCGRLILTKSGYRQELSGVGCVWSELSSKMICGWFTLDAVPNNFTSSFNEQRGKMPAKKGGNSME